MVTRSIDAHGRVLKSTHAAARVRFCHRPVAVALSAPLAFAPLLAHHSKSRS